MGRPPSNGGPSFRFNQAEIAEMEAILQAHKIAMPERQVLVNLAEKFSKSEERLGKIEVQMKQVWNWFQNRRYAIRAKAAKAPGKLNVTHMTPNDSSMVKGVPQVIQPHAASSVNVRSLPQAPQHPTVPSASVRTFPQAPMQPPAFSVQSAGRMADNSQMEYEAKSARDGAWYDVSTFLSHRSLETGDPEVFVRFAGFGAEEDEWVNVRKNVRQRSLPCEASECVAVLPSDLILCFQEGKEQALYFDAHVLDAQRRRHDVRGCRCRFLVRYDHDQSEEIVALRKICRRPETDYRLQQLHAVNESMMANQNKNGATNNNIHTVSTLRVYPPAEVQPKQHKMEPTLQPSVPEAPQKRQRLDSMVPPKPVMANVPKVQQTVQAAVPAPRQALPKPEKVVPVVPVQPLQVSGQSQNVVHVVPPCTDEVPVQLQKVQPVMHDLTAEVSVDTRMVEADAPSSSEAKQELQSEEKNKSVPSGEITESVGPTILPSVETPREEEPDLSKLQKEPVASDNSVEVPAELHDAQPAAPDQPHTSGLETKTEEPVLPVSVNEPNVVEVEELETKTEDPVVPVFSSDPNAVQAAIETEPAVFVSNNDSNVLQEANTEDDVVPVEADVVQESIETETEELVVLADPNPAQEAKTEKPMVLFNPDVVPEAKIEEPMVLVDPNVVQEANIEEPAVPVNTDAAQDAKTEKPFVPIDAAQEAKTEEPTVPVDTNAAAQEAKTEEPMVPVDTKVAQEAKTEEPVVPVGPNVVHEAKFNEPVQRVNGSNVTDATIEQPDVSEFVEINEDKHANVPDNVGDHNVENLEIKPEDAAVAMEEG